MGDHLLQYIDSDTVIHRADSLSKLIWVLVVVIATFQLTSTTARGLMLASLLFVALFVARVPLRVIIRSSPLIFGVASLLGLFHMMITPGEAAFRLGPIAPSWEGLITGAGFFFRLAIMVMASFMLIWTTDIRDLMVGLVRVGLPYRFAFAIFMALRFLPLVQQEVAAVRAAHAIRGKAARSPLQHRFRLWQRYLFTVIVNGLRKAESTAIAVESRGFGAYPDRTFVKDFHWSVSGLILIAIYLAFAGGLLYWERIA